VQCQKHKDNLRKAVSKVFKKDRVISGARIFSLMNTIECVEKIILLGIGKCGAERHELEKYQKKFLRATRVGATGPFQPM
jgi:hypothetical protein